MSANEIYGNQNVWPSQTEFTTPTAPTFGGFLAAFVQPLIVMISWWGATVVVGILLFTSFADDRVWNRYTWDGPIVYLIPLLPFIGLFLIGFLVPILLSVKWYREYRTAGGRVFR